MRHDDDNDDVVAPMPQPRTLRRRFVPGTWAEVPFWVSLEASTPIRLLSVPVWACVHEGRFGCPARTESVLQPEQKAKSRPRKGLGRIGFAARSCCGGRLCGRLPRAVIPQGDVIILPSPPPATPWKFPRSQVSRILDWDLRVPSMPSRQPVGPVTHSLGLVIPAHKPHEPPWPPRATQNSDLYSMPDPPPGDACGLAPRQTDRGSTIFRPVGSLPTIMRPREPRPIPPRKGRCPTTRALDRRAGRSTDATRRSEETTERAYSSRNGAAVQQAW